MAAGQGVRLIRDPPGDVRIGGAAIGRVVVEAAVLGRVMRGRHHGSRRPGRSPGPRLWVRMAWEIAGVGVYPFRSRRSSRAPHWPSAPRGRSQRRSRDDPTFRRPRAARAPSHPAASCSTPSSSGECWRASRGRPASPRGYPAHEWRDAQTSRAWQSTTLPRFRFLGGVGKGEQTGALRALPEPDVSENREHDDYDADDVEHVAHGVPPSCSFTLVAADPSANWT
jgi:hypothetical protein